MLCKLFTQIGSDNFLRGIKLDGGAAAFSSRKRFATFKSLSERRRPSANDDDDETIRFR